jgi:hypothetical protein
MSERFQRQRLQAHSNGPAHIRDPDDARRTVCGSIVSRSWWPALTTQRDCEQCARKMLREEKTP